MPTPDDDFWEPEPTDEEYLEALNVQDEIIKERLFAVLGRCASVRTIAFEKGVENQVLLDKIRDTVLIGFQLGISTSVNGAEFTFMPTWQFEESDGPGDAQISPNIEPAWEAWGRLNAFDFAYAFAHYPRPHDGRTVLEIANSPDVQSRKYLESIMISWQNLSR